MKQWINKHKYICFGGVVIVLALAAAYFLGGSHKTSHTITDEELAQTVENTSDGLTAAEEDPSADSGVEAIRRSVSADGEKNNRSETEQTPETTESSAAQPPQSSTETGSSEDAGPAATTQAASSDAGQTTTEAETESTTEQTEPTVTCTISVSCSEILDHMDALDPSKAGLIPADGSILAPVTVTVTDGESVYDVLRSTCSNMGILLDATYSPIYGSAYIRGINNIYEFDCGNLSGWKYRVNGEYPNYGCSAYMVKDGDVIEWTYTCSMD